VLVYLQTGTFPPTGRKRVPKKSELEKMFGPESAAKAVKSKITNIRKLSDALSILAINLAKAHKAIGKGGNRCMGINGGGSSGGQAVNFECDISLTDTGTFKKEEKMVILDKINELVVEYLSRETAATYEEIQRLGKEL
jgi:hypothetical protein